MRPFVLRGFPVLGSQLTHHSYESNRIALTPLFQRIIIVIS